MRWSSLPWIKFVVFLMVCNGGSNHILSVGEVEETVQSRMIRLMIDTRDLQNPLSVDKIIDFEILRNLLTMAIESVVRDL